VFFWTTCHVLLSNIPNLLISILSRQMLIKINKLPICKICSYYIPSYNLCQLLSPSDAKGVLVWTRCLPVQNLVKRFLDTVYMKYATLYILTSFRPPLTLHTFTLCLSATVVNTGTFPRYAYTHDDRNLIIYNV